MGVFHNSTDIAQRMLFLLVFNIKHKSTGIKWLERDTAGLFNQRQFDALVMLKHLQK